MGRGDEDGGVTSIEDAVVEEEADSSGGSCGAVDLLVGDGLSHDFVEFWAGSVVVSGVEPTV